MYTQTYELWRPDANSSSYSLGKLRETRKVAPFPTSLSTQIRPPRASTIHFEIAMPTPPPPLAVASPSQSRSKQQGISSAALPGPSAVTEQTSPPAVTPIPIPTSPPRQVNLIVLPRRFDM